MISESYFQNATRALHWSSQSTYLLISNKISHILCVLVQNGRDI